MKLKGLIAVPPLVNIITGVPRGAEDLLMVYAITDQPSHFLPFGKQPWTPQFIGYIDASETSGTSWQLDHMARFLGRLNGLGLDEKIQMLWHCRGHQCYGLEQHKRDVIEAAESVMNA